MNYKLLLIGINIVAASLLVAVYGFIAGDTGLLGLALSAGLVGGVLIAISSSYHEGVVDPLTEYIVLLTNGLTAIIEDLDLLNPSIYMVKRDDGYYLVFSKTEIQKINPGLGALYGVPYLAIPLTSVFNGVAALENLDEHSIESFLASYLVEEYGISKHVTTRKTGDFVRLEIIGVSKHIEKTSGYPLDPLMIISMGLLARATDAKSVRLVEKGTIPDGKYYVFRVEQSGG